MWILTPLPMGGKYPQSRRALDLAQEGAALGEDAAGLADERDVGLGIGVGGQAPAVLLVGGQRVEVDQRDSEVVGALLGQVVPSRPPQRSMIGGQVVAYFSKSSMPCGSSVYWMTHVITMSPSVLGLPRR